MSATTTPITLAITITVAALSIAGCEPTLGPVVGGSMLHDEHDEPDPEGDGDDQPPGDGDGDAGDPAPLLDLGGAGDGDGDGDEPLPEDDPEPEPECTSHTDCASLTSECTIGVCGPFGECEALPTNDGDACDDLDACTVGSTCSDGQCSGGAPLDCSGLDGECTVGECDQQTGACEAVEIDGCELEPEPEPEPEQPVCPIGAESCPCTNGGACDPGLVCGDGWTCLPPLEACGAELVIDYPTGGAPMTIVAVQVAGPMTDANIAATCQSCGLEPLCGSVENNSPCEPGYSEVWNGPTLTCRKQLNANSWQTYPLDYHQWDDTCTQLPPPPDTHAVTSHSLIARELGCPSPLSDCPELLNTWLFTAGNNQSRESLGGGQYEWISDGAAGIELFTGYLLPKQCWLGDCPYSNNEPQHVDGLGHWSPNKTDYADRRALCVVP